MRLVGVRHLLRVPMYVDGIERLLSEILKMCDGR